MTTAELEAKIYDTYYEQNPDGDARTNGLWKAVIDAKKHENAEMVLTDLLCEVECDHF